MGKLINLSGKQFGLLAVSRRAGTSRFGEALWSCTCKCGARVIVTSAHLRSHRQKSCGTCLRFHKKRGEGALNTFFYYYSYRAKRANLTFSLTRIDFEKLVTQPCRYCGTAPKLRTSHSKYFRPIPVNGIDRLDPTLGYELKNCVPCCTTCNMMKMSLSETEFISQIRKIYDFWE